MRFILSQRSKARRPIGDPLFVSWFICLAVASVFCTACGGAQTRLDPIGCNVIDRGISGRLLDKTSGAPISGARVQTVPETEIRASDKRGCFYVERDFTREGDIRIRTGTYALVIAFEDNRIGLNGDETLAVFDDMRIDGISLADDRVSAGRIEVPRVKVPGAPGTPDVVVFSPLGEGGAGGNKPE